MTEEMRFRPEMDNENFLLKDLRRNYVRAAANQGWFEQTWMGLTLWQIGEDLVRMQRMVHDIRPKWIVETGTKFGGSAIYWASILHSLGLYDSRVITLDLIEQPDAVEAFENHFLKGYVHSYILGDAADPSNVKKVEDIIAEDPGPTFVFLDDNHNRDHVLSELRQYSKFVTENSLIVVADTVYEDLDGTPVGKSNEKYPDVAKSNPRAAIKLFLDENDSFEMDTSFTGSGGPSLFPDGFLRRLKI